MPLDHLGPRRTSVLSGDAKPTEFAKQSDAGVAKPAKSGRPGEFLVAAVTLICPIASRPSATHAICVGAVVQGTPLEPTCRAAGNPANDGTPPRPFAAADNAADDGA